MNRLPGLQAEASSKKVPGIGLSSAAEAAGSTDLPRHAGGPSEEEAHRASGILALQPLESKENIRMIGSYRARRGYVRWVHTYTEVI